MLNFRWISAVYLLCILVSHGAFAAEPPRMLFQDGGVADTQSPSGRRTNFSMMRLPNNRFAFYDRNKPSDQPIAIPDRLGNLHTLRPALPSAMVGSEITKSGILGNTQVILTPENRVISIFVKSEKIDKGKASTVGLPQFLNVWVNDGNASQVNEPRLVWRGYNGSQMEYEQLPNGRILVPFGSFQPHMKAVPPMGRHKIVVMYSDDQGQTWTESESKLVSPCYENFNGANEGACEPAIERLIDGRIWMLFRTQAGFLYESFSSDNGTNWSTATASRFSTSTGPPNIMRHRDGALIVCWNNCEMPPRVDGVGVYGGRDALHIAVSRDEGVTWEGFREIYLDHRRNDNPAKSGDRGTAYPLAAFTEEGKFVVLAGQGIGGRNPILIDPDWIGESSAETDFSRGQDDCSVYKHYGPAKSWWRARAIGCQLVENPVDRSKKCLWLRKPDELPADGAVWNFPNGWSGTLSTRIRLGKGCLGASIALNDRMFDPSNDDGERLAMYRVDFTADARIGTLQLETDRWYDLRVEWALSQSDARLFINDRFAEKLPLLNDTLNGLSYVRLRSSATSIDATGFLVDDMKIRIEEAHAPKVDATQLKDQESRYIEQVVKHWK
jgi:BNR repeat-like domain